MSCPSKPTYPAVKRDRVAFFDQGGRLGVEVRYDNRALLSFLGPPCDLECHPESLDAEVSQRKGVQNVGIS